MNGKGMGIYGMLQGMGGQSPSQGQMPMGAQMLMGQMQGRRPQGQIPQGMDRRQMLAQLLAQYGGQRG